MERYRQRTVPVVFQGAYYYAGRWNDSQRTFHRGEQMWDDGSRIPHRQVLPVKPMRQITSSLTSDMVFKHERSWSGDPYKWDLQLDYRQICLDRSKFGLRQNGSAVWIEPPPVTAYPPGQARRLLQQALGEAQAGDWDVATFLAEFRKTNELVVRAGHRTLKRGQVVYDEAIRRRRRSRIDRAKTLYDLFNDIWMEYRYGWRILMYDLESAAKAVESLRARESRIIRRHTSHHQDVIPSGPSTITSQYKHSLTGSGVGGGVALTAERLFGGYRSTRAGVGLRPALNGRALGASPLVTGYELIPYSFVVDWFTNLGEAVSAWAPSLRGEILFSWVTEEIGTVSAQKATGSFDVVGPWIPRLGGFETDRYTFTGSAEWKLKEKVRFSQQPRFDLSFRVNFDWKKLIDSGALLRNQAKSFASRR